MIEISLSYDISPSIDDLIGIVKVVHSFYEKL